MCDCHNVINSYLLTYLLTYLLLGFRQYMYCHTPMKHGLCLPLTSRLWRNSTWSAIRQIPQDKWQRPQWDLQVLTFINFYGCAASPSLPFSPPFSPSSPLPFVHFLISTSFPATSKRSEERSSSLSGPRRSQAAKRCCDVSMTIYAGRVVGRQYLAAYLHRKYSSFFP